MPLVDLVSPSALRLEVGQILSPSLDGPQRQTDYSSVGEIRHTVVGNGDTESCLNLTWRVFSAAEQLCLRNAYRGVMHVEASTTPTSKSTTPDVEHKVQEATLPLFEFITCGKSLLLQLLSSFLEDLAMWSSAMPPPRLLLAAACMLGNSLPAFAQTTDVDSNVIEPADFNLSNALLEHGVAVSDIPSLSTLGKPLQPECSVAVSCSFRSTSSHKLTLYKFSATC